MPGIWTTVIDFLRLNRNDPPLVFLSHSGGETAPARDLANHLERQGWRVWLDVDRLRSGDSCIDEIESA